jgi:hypothetical protein
MNKKIYLAINEQEISSIQSILIKRIPNSEICSLTTREETLEIIKSSFHMLIVPAEFIDLEQLKTTLLDGTVILLDRTIKDSIEINENIQMYKDIETYSNFLMTKPLENPILKDKKAESPKEEQSSNKEAKPTPIQFEDNETKQEEEGKDIQKPKTKENQKSPSELDEANFGEPVIIDPFPPEINIKIESDLKTKTDLAIAENYQYGTWQGNKIIGVWSPIAATGVTTFIVNLAFYLCEDKADIAVIEPLSENANLKELLSDYTSVPKAWRSYLEYTQKEDISAKSMKWLYHGVDWLPIGQYELERKWKMQQLCKLMHDQIRLTQKSNVTFIDFPPGKMSPYILESLPYLDEFWIMVDNRQKSYRYRSYIEELIEKYHLNAKLIVNRSFSSGQTKLIVKHFEQPLLATIPVLMEALQNEWGKQPIIKKPEIRELLQPTFDKLSTHLKLPDRPKLNIWDKVKRFITYS